MKNQTPGIILELKNQTPAIILEDICLSMVLNGYGNNAPNKMSAEVKTA